MSSPTDKRSDFIPSPFRPSLLLLLWILWIDIFSEQDNQLTITRILCRLSLSAPPLLVPLPYLLRFWDRESEGWCKKGEFFFFISLSLDRLNNTSIPEYDSTYGESWAIKMESERTKNKRFLKEELNSPICSSKVKISVFEVKIRNHSHSKIFRHIDFSAENEDWDTKRHMSTEGSSCIFYSRVYLLCF